MSNPSNFEEKQATACSLLRDKGIRYVINIRDLPFFFILISRIPTKSSFCVQNRVNNTDNV